VAATRISPGTTQEPKATAHAVGSGLWVLELAVDGALDRVDPATGLYIAESDRRMIACVVWTCLPC